jgi:hypothetical protein
MRPVAPTGPGAAVFLHSTQAVRSALWRGNQPIHLPALQAITPARVRKYAETARQRIRIEGGGYRRDHLRALAQRVEAADGEVRIMGAKGDLLRTLAAALGVKSATPGVRSSVLSWRRERIAGRSRPATVKWDWFVKAESVDPHRSVGLGEIEMHP